MSTRPLPNLYQPSIVSRRKIDPVENDLSRNQQGKGVQLRTWSQAVQGSQIFQAAPFPASASFRPQLANVKPSEISYPSTHLLGIPQEIRDVILELLHVPEERIGGQSGTGYQVCQHVCRQTYHETFARWNYQSMVLVPSNKTELFLARTLNVETLRSNAFQNVKSLIFEIRHDAPSNVFTQLAAVIERSQQLQELHLFGVGPDGYGNHTSSVARGCGKHDVSVMPMPPSLHIHGQHYHRRLTMVNSIHGLQDLRVLVLDNLNFPLLQAHVLKNKPRLEKVYIAADHRTVLHGEYKTYQHELGLRCLIFPVYDAAPPVKELRIDSNAILTVSRIVSRVAATLETLEWDIPDIVFQVHVKAISFYSEAAQLLHRLHTEAKRLRELRVCVTGAVSEDSYQFGNFMGAFKDCVSRMQSLQLVEVHIHSKSAWFDAEFVDALSPSVERLYVTDLFVKRDVQRLSNRVSAKTQTPLKYSVDEGAAIEIGEDLSRQDSIRFSRSRLGFVGYEYDLLLDPSAAKLQGDKMNVFLKLNGRLLDKELNQHLAKFDGKHIPPSKLSAKGRLDESDVSVQEAWSAATQDEIAENNKESVEYGLCVDDDEYFGHENEAEVVFQNEPVARGRQYSYPVIVEVEKECKFSNHWLSK